MSLYSFKEWVFIFCIYSVIGFIWETIYCSIVERRLVNRGFMKGPFLPIYGSGVCTMLVASAPFRDHIVIACLSGMICATVLEYVTGDLMEHLFKVRYWDYSTEKFNLNGYICLGASLAWFVATFIVNKVLQKPVDSLLNAMNDTTLIVVDSVVMGIAVIDFGISFKAAMDLRSVLVKIDAAKHEMKLMQKRLDVIIAVISEEAGDRYEKFTDSVSEKYGELANGISGRFGNFGDGVKKRLEYVVENVKGPGDKIMPDSGKKVIDELSGMKDRYAQTIGNYTSSLHPTRKIKEFFIRSIIRSNPSITSDKYAEALEELKKESESKT